MKRSALQRKSRLRRGAAQLERGRLAPRRATERRSSRVRDEQYLAWLRRQPCAVGGFLARAGHAYSLSWHCSGPTDPEHKREGVGAGQKASDADAWPCCRRHHDDRHALRGVFAGWSRGQLREFIRERIAEARGRYEREIASPAVPA